jgi:uncharacterized protein YciI
MFIIELTYKVSPEEIDRNLKPHMEYVEKYYGTGHFLASGRKEPRDGGIIFAKADSRSRMEDIVSKDPLNISGMAEYRIIEFKATKNIKAYKAFAGDE